MFAIIFIAGMIFLSGFALGWGIKNNKTTTFSSSSGDDRIVRELRKQRLDYYFNNPVVDELKKH